MMDSSRRMAVAVAGMLITLAVFRDAAAGCPRAQHQAGRKCVNVIPPANAELNILGDGWQCLPASAGQATSASSSRCRPTPDST